MNCTSRLFFVAAMVMSALVAMPSSQIDHPTQGRLILEIDSLNPEGVREELTSNVDLDLAQKYPGTNASSLLVTPLGYAINKFNEDRPKERNRSEGRNRSEEPKQCAFRIVCMIAAWSDLKKPTVTIEDPVVCQIPVLQQLYYHEHRFRLHPLAFKMLPIFLKRSADPNQQDAQGRISLHYFVQQYSWQFGDSAQLIEAIKLLLFHGADPNISDRENKRAFDDNPALLKKIRQEIKLTMTPFVVAGELCHRVHDQGEPVALPVPPDIPPMILKMLNYGRVLPRLFK